MTKGFNVTVKESVVINALPEAVWDFTQDWTRRSSWDPAILEAEILPGEKRGVRARTTAGTLLVHYKQSDRPKRTSLVMSDSTSWLVERRPETGRTEANYRAST